MKKITVYVRAPDDETRTLSFKRIPEISDREALDMGLAIDGNSLVRSIRADVRASFVKALRDTELWIVAELEKRGYEVEFG